MIAISRNIVGLARTRPDIFGTTEEEVSNAVKAEIEKKMEEPKQVIWDGHTGRRRKRMLFIVGRENEWVDGFEF
ncbi:hypothetical protein HAX54_009663, partial [Datura stramonium]|nr:hypothetical protein [Datura stramonium]